MARRFHGITSSPDKTNRSLMKHNSNELREHTNRDPMQKKHHGKHSITKQLEDTSFQDGRRNLAEHTKYLNLPHMWARLPKIPHHDFSAGTQAWGMFGGTRGLLANSVKFVAVWVIPAYLVLIINGISDSRLVYQQVCLALYKANGTLMLRLCC